MPEFEKGAPHVEPILGAPLMEIPEPRLRETGILTVEQLRATELRLLKYINGRADASDLLLRTKLQEVNEAQSIDLRASVERLERQAQQVATDAAERALDLTVRLHALDQQFQERLAGLGMQATTRDERQGQALQHVFSELVRHIVLNRAETEMKFALESDQRQRDLVDIIQQFRQEVDDRTAKGRWRRVKLWCQRTWQTMRGARHGR